MLNAEVIFQSRGVSCSRCHTKLAKLAKGVVNMDQKCDHGFEHMALKWTVFAQNSRLIPRQLRYVSLWLSKVDCIP